MEELKKQEQPRKLSYEELERAAGDLHMQYQKLAKEYQKAMQALSDRSFDYMSFFLTMLFKVLEHPDTYDSKFILWCSKNIEDSLRTFEKTITSGVQEEEAKENEKK